jgi:hypothetical protein
VARRFGEVFEREPVDTSPGEIGLDRTSPAPAA